MSSETVLQFSALPRDEGITPPSFEGRQDDYRCAAICSDTGPREAEPGSVDRLAPRPNTLEATDEYLIESAASADKEALAVLFRRYGRLIHTVAQRILRDASEADDLVQEVFLFLFRKASLFDPVLGTVRSWLLQVTWHRAIDRRRYLASRHFYTSLEVEDDLLESAPARGLLNLYEESLEGALGRETLRRIDRSLSEDQRRVIRLYFYEGHTIREIAALLSQTPGNIRNHYYRALEKMRREIFPAKPDRK